MQPEIEADERQTEDAAGQRVLNMDASLAQAAAGLAAKELVAAHRVDQYATSDAAMLGMAARAGAAVGHAAVAPNVKLEVDRAGGGLDVGQQPGEGLLPIVQQID